MAAPRSWWRPSTIRGHLTVLVLALAIPLVGLQVATTAEHYQHLVGSAEEGALTLADGMALAIEQFLEGAETQLTNLADTHARSVLEGEPCSGPLAVPAALHPFDLITLVDTDLEIVCTGGPVPEGTSPVDWESVSDVLETGRLTVGEPVEGAISQRLILPLAAPVSDDSDALIGVVVGSVSLEGLAPYMVAYPIEDHELVTVASPGMLIVSRSRDEGEWVGTEIPPFTEPEDRRGPNRAVARGIDNNGILRIWGQVRTERGWTIFAGVDEEVALAPARASATLQASFALVILLISAGLAFRSYRRVKTGLGDLGTRAAAAAAGVTEPLPADTPAEVAEVLERFYQTLADRDKAEAGQRRATARYQGIVDNVRFGIGVSTVDGEILEANQALADIFGYEDAEDLIDAGPISLHRSPEERQKWVDRVVQAQSFQGVETEGYRKDGSKVWVRCDGRVTTDEQGRHVIEAILHDISEEKRTEARLRQSQKMQAVGQLAGGIAHDFNNLLTVIAGNLEFVDESLEENHPLRPDIDQIREAAQRAGSLTAQLLSFARREQAQVGPVDLHRVLTDSERLLARLIGGRVYLETSFSLDPRPVSIEAGELQQIVMNLVLNARDAMPEGGRIGLTTVDRSVGGIPGVALRVSDHGVGMDSETRDQLFEPFFTTKPSGEGTGLGLSIVYGIVQRAHGTIEVDTALGDGTTFDIWLPLAAESMGSRSAGANGDQSASGSERLLVVEDDQLVRDFVRRALDEAGYRVIVAVDGPSALELAAASEEPVDLVVTDVVMPGMRGTELGEKLSEIWPRTPVLYMSGYSYDGDPTRAPESPRFFLNKPFRATDLCARVREVLDTAIAETA